LVATYFLQGVGAAAFVLASLSLPTVTFAEGEERNRASGYLRRRSCWSRGARRRLEVGLLICVRSAVIALPIVLLGLLKDGLPGEQEGDVNG
jgi:hypothetical protein